MRWIAGLLSGAAALLISGVATTSNAQSCDLVSREELVLEPLEAEEDGVPVEWGNWPESQVILDQVPTNHVRVWVFGGEDGRKICEATYD